MKKTIINLAFFASITMIFTGCATIVGSKTQRLTFDSHPKGSDVILNNKKTCKTPCIVELVKDTYTSVTFSKEGYESKTIEVKQGIAPIFWGNIIFGGLLGSSTDSQSSAMYEYKPDRYFIDLKENN